MLNPDLKAKSEKGYDRSQQLPRDSKSFQMTNGCTLYGATPAQGIKLTLMRPMYSLRRARGDTQAITRRRPLSGKIIRQA